MWNKFLSAFLVFLLVMVPTLAHANGDSTGTALPELEGRVTTLEMGNSAPFSGILLDPEASAKILAERKFSLLRYDLKLDLEIQKMQVKHDLEFGLLQARYDSLGTQHEQILNLKNNEITRLQEIVKDRPNSNSEWWLAGGVALGILISIGVFYAAVEVSKQ
jgi:hypothetical protein